VALPQAIEFRPFRAFQTASEDIDIEFTWLTTLSVRVAFRKNQTRQKKLQACFKQTIYHRATQLDFFETNADEMD
jgi:hypothetical protein